MTEPIARVELLRAYRRVVEARDIATPPSRLAELAADPWRPTRIAVAVHPWAPPRRRRRPVGRHRLECRVARGAASGGRR
jgi:hypothetical protein